MKGNRPVIVDIRNGFQDHRDYIQDDQGNDKAINDFIPAGFAQFRMQEYMHLPFGVLVHKQ